MKRPRVLLLGDGVALTTGFSQVMRHVAAEFNRRGWHVGQLASLDTKGNADPYLAQSVHPTFGATSTDYNGFLKIEEALSEHEPDVLFLNCDPGTAAQWFRHIARIGEWARKVPTVLYAPVEGAPIMPIHATAFQYPTRSYTYTEWSANILRDAAGLQVPWVWHGVDRSLFQPQPGWARTALRRRLGWEDRFVVLYVGRNAGRKAHDRLIKAIAELHGRGYTDVLLSLHCSAFDRHQLQGWDLDFFSRYCGVRDHVQFSDQADAAHGIAQPSLIEKYQAADLYVHAAKVEGFGLPILEAMACGLPVVIPKDGGNMEEIVSDAAAARIEPRDWETWFNGAQLANVAPEDFALTIKVLKERPEVRHAASERGSRRAQLFSWGVMARTLTEAAASVAAVPA